MEIQKKENNERHTDHRYDPSRFTRIWCKGSKAKLTGYMFVMEIACITAFSIGYFLDPLLLRKTWLVFFGTLSVLLGIGIYFIYAGIICNK